MHKEWKSEHLTKLQEVIFNLKCRNTNEQMISTPWQNIYRNVLCLNVTNKSATSCSLLLVQTHDVKVKYDSLAGSFTGLPTCVFTSRHVDPVCCPRFTAYWITSALKQSSPKKAKAQVGLKLRPGPSALDPGERIRSDTRVSLSSISSEQSGLICS